MTTPACRVRRRLQVTETIPLQEFDKQGLLIRGNLRDQREVVFKRVCDKVAELFGPGKFEVRGEEQTEAE